MTTLLLNSNQTLANMTENIAKAKAIRITSVNDVIKATIEFSRENSEVFSSKKNAISVFLKSVYGDKTVNIYTKRAVKVAKAILMDGYKLRREFLTLAQMEHLTAFTKETVNGIFEEFDDEGYIIAVKDLINDAKIIKQTKVFSVAKAKKL